MLAEHNSSSESHPSGLKPDLRTVLLGSEGPIRFHMGKALPIAGIIGEAPGPRSDWRYPLIGGSSGRRLQKMFEMSFLVYLKTFRTYNLLHVYPGKKWPLGAARKAAGVILEDSRDLGGLIILGRKVADACEIHGDFFTIIQCNAMPVLLLPHPSGLNHVWNDPSNVTRVLPIATDLLARAKEQQHGRDST